MTTRKTAAEVLEERERYPLGKPRPYSPDHPNLLAEELPVKRAENVRLVSGFGGFLLVSIALMVMVYGAHGLLADDLYVPAKRMPGTHYRGHSAWLIYGMLLSFAGCLLTVAFSRFDAVRRRMTNRTLLTVLSISTVVFMIAGLTSHAVYR